MGDMDSELNALRENLPTLVEGEGSTSCVQLYTEGLAQRIILLYTEGQSLHKISKLAEMPSYAVMLRWARDHKDFRMQIDQARALRGLHFEDKALEAAEDAIISDDVPAKRLQFDAYKWAAEVNDPSRYGKKVTHSGDPEKPIQFVIATGFPEPNAHQQPPKLGSDGLIIREKPPITVESEVKDVRPAADDEYTNTGKESLFDRLTREAEEKVGRSDAVRSGDSGEAPSAHAPDAPQPA